MEAALPPLPPGDYELGIVSDPGHAARALDVTIADLELRVAAAR